MPRLDAAFVQEALDARLSGRAPEEPFAGVGSDSRRVSPGQLFVALAGPNFDGHDFVAAALDAGAAGALVREGFSLAGRLEACLLQVADTTRSLGDLAGAWRREHSARVCAITGSNGKTTCKEMLAAVLGRRHRVLKNRGNLNNHIGLPLTLLELSGEHTAVVVELGMNAPGEIARLTEVAAPEVGVVTNAGPAHIGRLGSLQAIAEAKAELYRGLSPAALAVVNADDPLLAHWAKDAPCRTISFGLCDTAQVRGRDLSGLGGRAAFSLELPSGPPRRVRLAVPGRHNVANALAAAAAAVGMGLGGDDIKAGLEEFRPVEGRLVLKQSMWGYFVVDDSYNANPASLNAGVDALKDIASGRRMVLVLGDMRELGPDSLALHQRAGAEAVERGCSMVLALGAQGEAVARGARGAGLDQELARGFSDLHELLETAFALLDDGDVVLVKGSRSSRMERVVNALLGGEAD